MTDVFKQDSKQVEEKDPKELYDEQIQEIIKDVDPDDLMALHMLYVQCIQDGLWTWDRVPDQVYAYVVYIWVTTVGKLPEEAWR